MIKEQVIQDFLENLSSKQPVPGGGGASALAGAVGSALGSMVSNLTIGKKKYMDVEVDVKEYLEALTKLQSRFLSLADEDENVFAPLAAAYGLPCATEEEKAQKEKVMEVNLSAASLVPIKTMEITIDLLKLLAELAGKGSKLAISDVGVGVQFARTALLGAVMNVYINTKSMKNREKAEELNAYADELVADGTNRADRIYEAVLEKLR